MKKLFIVYYRLILGAKKTIQQVKMVIITNAFNLFFHCLCYR